jgi:hypothetical protein
LGQGFVGISVGRKVDRNRRRLAGVLMDQQFNHAANDSPRSGSTKRITPVIWAVIVVTAVAVAIWFEMKW